VTWTTTDDSTEAFLLSVFQKEERKRHTVEEAKKAEQNRGLKKRRNPDKKSRFTIDIVQVINA
jgi:hypothetical protein